MIERQEHKMTEITQSSESSEQEVRQANPWKKGLPPGTFYEGMLDDYEVYFSPGGIKWHRRRCNGQHRFVEVINGR